VTVVVLLALMIAVLQIFGVISADDAVLKHCARIPPRIIMRNVLCAVASLPARAFFPSLFF
jgi:hypothetical protein